MIDFVTEHVIGVDSLAKRLEVSTDTIRRWFRQGLERARVGGKVYTSLEAVQRFSQQSSTRAHVSQRQSHRELEDATRRLRAMGVNVGVKTDYEQAMKAFEERHGSLRKRKQ